MTDREAYARCDYLWPHGERCRYPAKDPTRYCGVHKRGQKTSWSRARASFNALETRLWRCRVRIGDEMQKRGLRFGNPKLEWLIEDVKADREIFEWVTHARKVRA
jgi:hypothetical protein